jgi:hypothetical protein
MEAMQYGRNWDIMDVLKLFIESSLKGAVPEPDLKDGDSTHTGGIYPLAVE